MFSSLLILFCPVGGQRFNGYPGQAVVSVLDGISGMILFSKTWSKQNKLKVQCFNFIANVLLANFANVHLT